jgi:hypothetical protein
MSQYTLSITIKKLKKKIIIEKPIKQNDKDPVTICVQ